MANCKLSVIIPMYNSCENVANTLASLGTQAIENGYMDSIQVIVVDDGSEEDASKVIEACETYGFEYYWQENGGEGVARNRGLSLAKGEYFQYIDADDEITNDYLKVSMEEADMGYDLVARSWRMADGRIGDRHPEPLVNWNVWSWMFRTEKFNSYKFDENRLFATDYFWLVEVIKQELNTYIGNSVINIYHTDNPNSLTARWARGELAELKSDSQA